MHGRGISISWPWCTLKHWEEITHPVPLHRRSWLKMSNYQMGEREACLWNKQNKLFSAFVLPNRRVSEAWSTLSLRLCPLLFPQKKLFPVVSDWISDQWFLLLLLLLLLPHASRWKWQLTRDHLPYVWREEMRHNKLLSIRVSRLRGSQLFVLAAERLLELYETARFWLWLRTRRVLLSITEGVVGVRTGV